MVRSNMYLKWEIFLCHLKEVHVWDHACVTDIDETKTEHFSRGSCQQYVFHTSSTIPVPTDFIWQGFLHATTYPSPARRGAALLSRVQCQELLRSAATSLRSDTWTFFPPLLKKRFHTRLFLSYSTKTVSSCPACIFFVFFFLRREIYGMRYFFYKSCINNVASSQFLLIEEEVSSV